MQRNNVIFVLFIITVITISVYFILNSANSTQIKVSISNSTTLMVAPNILPPVPQDFTTNDTDKIQWTPNYHLKIGDFTGKPNYANSNVAWTHWDIIPTHFDIRFIGSYPNLKYSVTNIRIHGFFIKDQSWYKENKTICNNSETSEQLLQHEQGHFDLSEIFARIAYSESLKELDNKTFVAEGNSSSIQKVNANSSTSDKIQKIINTIGEEMRNNDTLYETYSKNGCNWVSQEAYNNYFKKLRE